MVDREPSVSEEELHAYVDGQIAGGECAAIEKWLESHPEDAARVAAWRAQADAMRARYGAVANEPVRGASVFQRWHAAISVCRGPRPPPRGSPLSRGGGPGGFATRSWGGRGPRPNWRARP